MDSGVGSGFKQRIGNFGVWLPGKMITPEIASEIEDLGFGAIWIGGSTPGDLTAVRPLIAATTSIGIVTAVINIWKSPASEVASAFFELPEEDRQRVLLGFGPGHAERAGHVATRPYSSLFTYFDELDSYGVPTASRIVGALGPRLLQLGAARAAGVHTFLSTPKHTREVRELLGPIPLVVPEQTVMFAPDKIAASSMSRDFLASYLTLSNFRNHFLRLGFSEPELDGGASDTLVKAIVARDGADSARLHLAAGADHVALQIVATSQAAVMEGYRQLAKSLNL